MRSCNGYREQSQSQQPPVRRIHVNAKVVTFGEIMLRLSPSGYQRFAQAASYNVARGGSEANATVSLANYSLNACS